MISILLFLWQAWLVRSIGINVGTGQMSDRIPDEQWVQYFDRCSPYCPTPDIKYYWRDAAQLDLQMSRWGNATSAILAVQNEELPFTGGQSVVNGFDRFMPIIRAFAIGNEADAYMTPSEFSSIVIGSLRRIRETLPRHIPVSTPITMRMFGWEDLRVPAEWEEVWLELLRVLDTSESPLMVNIYPYLSWQNHQNRYTLEYALGDLLDDKLTAVRALLQQNGYGHIPIWVTETGWPTGGGDGASTDHAFMYWERASRTNATIYWFEWVDENRKPGPEDEHYYGLFTQDGRYKFEDKKKKIFR